MSLTPHWSLPCSSMDFGENEKHYGESYNDIEKILNEHKKFETSLYDSSRYQEIDYSLSKNTDFERVPSSHPLHYAIQKGDSTNRRNKFQNQSAALENISEPTESSPRSVRAFPKEEEKTLSSFSVSFEETVERYKPLPEYDSENKINP